ncbi:hypothetical protein AB0M46_25255 [Dactylosporangium sp. NPDC051485]|uniref:hypothetical protein n=1 Tax=Dactylosporangium sp. NPDC051485 TaxID=3154846 RepID=UPI0034380E5F
MLRRLLPRPDSGEGLMRFGVRLLVVVLCAVTLLQAMRPAVYSTRQGVDSIRNRSNEQAAPRHMEEQLGRDIHEQIPAGTRVAVVDEDLNWRLRLAAAATNQGMVVVGDTVARTPVVGSGVQLEIWRESDPAAPYGVRLMTRKPVTS